MRIDEAAIRVMAQQNLSSIWYGDFGACEDIYELARGRGSHPLNKIAAVLSTIARSPRFERTGCS